MILDNKITREATYEEVMDFLNSFEDVDSMLLDFLEDSKPDIKVISGNEETSYNYDDFLKIFDEDGLDAL